MKSNFHLETQKKDQQPHIVLHGVFDGASAFELIQAIEKEYKQGDSIFINTNRLVQTLPFGKAILEHHLPKNVLRTKIHFSGIRAKEIIPDGCILNQKKESSSHLCKGTCKNCKCRQN